LHRSIFLIDQFACHCFAIASSARSKSDRDLESTEYDWIIGAYDSDQRGLLLVPLVISLVILHFVNVVGRMLPAKADKI
jgi:hypothetical protein